MSTTMSRREVLKAGLTAASIAAMGFPIATMPALAQGETLVPFTDIPDTMTFDSGPSSPNRFLDIRTIEGQLTPRDKFFATQHLGQPEVDASSYKLKVTGLVNKPIELTLDELKKRPATQLAAGFECSGNSPRRIEGMVSNGMFTGTRLKDLLNGAGVKADGKEIVFFGTDHAEESVPFRGQTFKVDQRFGRSMTLDNVMKRDPIIAYAMNGEPLTKHQGFPVRLIVPGWYGVCNVKWLAQIHVQDVRFMGNYQARWYLTLRSENVGGQEIWKEMEVTRLQLKSVIGRVTKNGNQYMVHGFVLNDGTPLKSVEVSVDNGPWRPATLDKSNTQYSWKLFSYNWEGATPGEHTLVSRVTDVNGNVQPTSDELQKVKKTFLEDNSQFPRKLRIS